MNLNLPNIVIVLSIRVKQEAREVRAGVQEGDDAIRRLSPKFPAGYLLQGWLKILLI